jgi:hypothetical protein
MQGKKLVNYEDYYFRELLGALNIPFSFVLLLIIPKQKILFLGAPPSFFLKFLPPSNSDCPYQA